MMVILTDGELEVVIKDLTERAKDLLFTTLEPKMKESLTQSLKNQDIDPTKTDQRITVNYELSFVVGDIFQILGHLRRRGQP